MGWGQGDTMDPIAQLVSLSNPTLPVGSHLKIDLPSIPLLLQWQVFSGVWQASKEALSITGPLEFTPLVK